jgi:hypothetical protein
MVFIVVGCGGEPNDEYGETVSPAFGEDKNDKSDEAGGEYDWTTDNTPEPQGKFENLAQSPGEAKRLSACYQKLVMNCYQVHEEVRTRETEKEITGDMNSHMIASYFAAEKDFILACIANHVGG